MLIGICVTLFLVGVTSLFVHRSLKERKLSDARLASNAMPSATVPQAEPTAKAAPAPLTSDLPKAVIPANTASTPSPHMKDVTSPPVKTPSITEKEIKEGVSTLRRFFEADTIEQKLSFFIPAPKLHSKAMAFADSPEMRKANIETIGPKVVYNDGYIVTTARLLGKQPQLVVMQKTSDGKPEPFLIDFDSFFGWSERYIESLLQERPSEPSLLRAYVSRVGSLAPDPDGNWTISLMDRWQKKTIDALVNPGLLINDSTRKALNDGYAVPMMVKVRYIPDKAKGSIALIDEVVSRGWHTKASNTE